MKVKFNVYDGQTRTLNVKSTDDFKSILLNKLKVCERAYVQTYWGEALPQSGTFEEWNIKDNARLQVVLSEDSGCSGC